MNGLASYYTKFLYSENPNVTQTIAHIEEKVQLHS